MHYSFFLRRLLINPRREVWDLLYQYLLNGLAVLEDARHGLARDLRVGTVEINFRVYRSVEEVEMNSG